MGKKLILDGDWGGDEMQMAAIALGNQKHFNVLGCTAVFGNSSIDHMVKNAGCFLRLFNRDHDVPVYIGAAGPTGGKVISSEDGDQAWAHDGKGGIALEPSHKPPEKQSAVDYILQTLHENDENTISLIASGPLTNYAQAILSDPKTMRRARDLTIMGGCTDLVPAVDMPFRQGNITPHAEFNFFMAPDDAQIVM